MHSSVDLALSISILEHLNAEMRRMAQEYEEEAVKLARPSMRIKLLLAGLLTAIAAPIVDWLT